MNRLLFKFPCSSGLRSSAKQARTARLLGAAQLPAAASVLAPLARARPSRPIICPGRDLCRRFDPTVLRNFRGIKTSHRQSLPQNPSSTSSFLPFFLTQAAAADAARRRGTAGAATGLPPLSFLPERRRPMRLAVGPHAATPVRPRSSWAFLFSLLSHFLPLLLLP